MMELLKYNEIYLRMKYCQSEIYKANKSDIIYIVDH